MLKKKTIRVFGNKYYLLGKSKDGDLYYMQEPEWQCGWYWGGLYLTVFTNQRQPERSRDISMHTHFDYLFMQGNKCCRDAFKEYFKETVLTDSEIYELCDYMKTFYTLKSVAELFKNGYSHQTEHAKIEALKSEDQRDLVNKVWLPEVFKRIETLLTPAE